jgi:hypothetical protein
MNEWINEWMNECEWVLYLDGGMGMNKCQEGTATVPVGVICGSDALVLMHDC